MTDTERSVLNPSVYEALWMHSHDLVSIIGADGTMRYASPSYSRTLGYETEELLGTSIFTRIHPDDMETVREAFFRVLDGKEPTTVRFRYRHKAGHWRVIEATGANHLDDPVIKGLVVNGRDISERIEAEEQLRAQEARSVELLEQRVDERTRELSTLLDVSRTVASTLDLETLLSLVLDALQRLVGYDGASISVVHGDELVIVVGRPGYGEPRPGTQRVPLEERSSIWDMVARGKTLIIDDVLSDAPVAVAYRQAAMATGYSDISSFRSWMGLPLMLKDRVTGVLSLIHRDPAAFTVHHGDLLQGVTQQVAVAIENVQLYERAQEAAVIEERQRLSRELHDSVSQVFYSVALGTKTARAVVERDPQTAREALDFTLTQAERGLAEMRALIFELRPESLEQEGLVAALQRQVAALEARHSVSIDLSLSAEPEAQLAVKEAIYRIAQEALNNTFKHGRASSISVSLDWLDGDVLLEVRDDGVGLDPSNQYPGHLGLQSMRERAARLHGHLDVESGPGQGTRIRARLPGRRG